jgi:peptidoglycan/LPS O-acetylase OafA/YrhL
VSGTGDAQTFHLVMRTWQGYYLPAFALLVWVGALGRGPLSRVLTCSPLVYLGELSYGIYIFHGPVLILIAKNFPATGWAAETHLYTVVGVSAVAILGVSALSFHLWETPIRRWVRGRPSRSTAEAPGTPAIVFTEPVRQAA